MDTKEIIAQIDAEIVRLQEVKSILSGTTTTITKAKRGPNKIAEAAAPVAKKRKMSPGRARIAAAQKARWAKSKKAAKAA